MGSPRRAASTARGPARSWAFLPRGGFQAPSVTLEATSDMNADLQRPGSMGCRCFAALKGTAAEPTRTCASCQGGCGRPPSPCHPSFCQPKRM